MINFINHHVTLTLADCTEFVDSPARVKKARKVCREIMAIFMNFSLTYHGITMNTAMGVGCPLFSMMGVVRPVV